jgi:hypothetical protein
LQGKEQLKLTVRNFEIESSFLDSKKVKVSNLKESVVISVAAGFCSISTVKIISLGFAAVLLKPL